MVIAMADQIKGVIQRYIKKVRPVILSHHGQDNSDPKCISVPLFPSSVVSAAANNFRIANNRPMERWIWSKPELRGGFSASDIR